MTAKRGRPPTGRTTKVIRVPDDMDTELMLHLYYDVLPALRQAKEKTEENLDSPRYYYLAKLLDNCNL